jgi:hypothetical protein
VPQFICLFSVGYNKLLNVKMLTPLKVLKKTTIRMLLFLQGNVVQLINHNKMPGQMRRHFVAGEAVQAGS